METLLDIIKYIFTIYPHPNELSKARLVKMVYLVDWKSALMHEVQITDINWVFNHYGPYVNDIIDVVRDDKIDFEVMKTTNSYGEEKELIKLINSNLQYTISDEAKEVVGFVVDSTKNLFWDDFIKLIYSTYPIATQNRYETLDLVKLAKEYKQSKN